jgi:NADPH:quinone reductase-like Zn-dependent oxidoreductase
MTRFFTGLTTPRATVPGNEFARVIEAIGSGVTSFQVGDKCSAATTARSVLTEHISTPEDGSIATMPANMTYQEAAPST